MSASKIATPADGSDDALLKTVTAEQLNAFRDEIFNPKYVQDHPHQFINTAWAKPHMDQLKAFLAASGDTHPLPRRSAAATAAPPAPDLIDLTTPPRPSRRSVKREPPDALESPPRKAIKREPSFIDLTESPTIFVKDELPFTAVPDADVMEALTPYMTEDDTDLPVSRPPSSASSSIFDTDGEWEPDPEYMSSDQSIANDDDGSLLSPGLYTKTASLTEWLDPRYHSVAIDMPFAITKSFSVERVEYADFLPDYIPVPRMHTAYLFDLRGPEFDLKKDGRLMTADALIKNKCQDSWEGGTGTGDSSVEISEVFELFIDEVDGPVRCRRTRLKCKGCKHCEYVDKERWLKDRYELDPSERQALFDEQAAANNREGETPASHAIQFFSLISNSECPVLVDKHGKKCGGGPVIVRAAKQYGDSTYIGCSGWRLDRQSKHRTHRIPPQVDVKLLAKLMRGETVEYDTPPCPMFVPPHIGFRQKICKFYHVAGGKAIVDAHIVHEQCPARLWIFVPLDETLRVALVIQGKGKTLPVAHNHPLLASAKAWAGARARFLEAVEASEEIGVTTGKVLKAPTTKLVLNGGRPTDVHPSLANKRILRDLTSKKVKEDAPAGRGVAGVFNLLMHDLTLPYQARYVHKVIVNEDHTIVVTYVPALLALIHDVSFLDVDKSFKRTDTLDEWEISTMVRSHQAAITLARFYTNGSDRAHFKLLFDTLRDEVFTCTKRALAFKRLTKGGTLLNLGMDMELAQILGAADSFLGTNDPEFSQITTKDPEVLATYIIRVCRCHVMRAVLELKKEVTAEQYELLRQFPDLRDEQALQDFEVFIGALKSKKVKDWYAHKKVNRYLIPMIVKSLSKIHPDDWIVNPATTNLGEGAHARINKVMGTRLTLLDGIRSARMFDEDEAERLQKENMTGVAADRTAGVRKRMKNNAARLQRAHIQSVEARERQAKLEDLQATLRQQKANAQETQKQLTALKGPAKPRQPRKKPAPAESSSCGRADAGQNLAAQCGLEAPSMHDPSLLPPLSASFENQAYSFDATLDPEFSAALWNSSDPTDPFDINFMNNAGPSGAASADLPSLDPWAEAQTFEAILGDIQLDQETVDDLDKLINWPTEQGGSMFDSGAFRGPGDGY
ncbi:hypothetical protein EV715DRAFT_287324 [Schizophyllum commune]